MTEPVRSNPAVSPSPAPTSRRTFVQTAAALTGALSAASMSTRTLAVPAVHAAGSEEIKVGLIGCGGRGRGAIMNAVNASYQVKVTALADAFDDPLQSCRNLLKTQAKQQYAVTDDMCFVGIDAYKQMIPEVDVVLLCSPPHFRPQHLEAAITAGKHVFCEKPIATDAVGVRRVLELSELAEQKNLCIVSGLCWRYDRGVKATVERIKDGAIGDIVTTQENYLTGTLWQKPRRPEWSDMEYQLRNWLYFRWLSGDHIVEQFIHSLDKSLWLHNDEPPVFCYGLGGRQVRTGEEFGDIYDHFSVVYEWADGSRTFAHTRQMSDCMNEVEDYIYGTKGTAKILANEIRGESGNWKYDGDKPNMYDEEHRELFKAIQEGRVINNGKYMSYSTLMAIMGREACYSGARVEWDKLLNSPLDLAPPSYALDAKPPEVVVPMPGRYKLA
jgi:myo-inositol 2-dehydrogenase / D-chiro-inositol 1-dehydrogenase